MSGTQPQATQATEQTVGEPKRRPWPDLSGYGLYFGVIEMPNRERRLVMVDTKASWSTLARRMGFQQSRWLGVWVRTDLSFKIPDFKTLFPRATISQMTDQEIRDQIRVKLLERQSMRMSQMNDAVRRAQDKRLTWHPTRVRVEPKATPQPQPTPTAVPPQGPAVTPDTAATPVAKRPRLLKPARVVAKQDKAPPSQEVQALVQEILPQGPDTAEEHDDAELVQEIVVDAPARADEPAEVERVVSADVAIRQTIYLGLNHQGQQVFESGDGLRFIRNADGVVSRESEPTGGPGFLRGGSASDLHLCAAGLVCEIESGKNLHSDDFVRYLVAIFGEDALEDKDSVNKLQAAIDSAMMEASMRVGGADGNAFQHALKLHEGRPSFWRQPGTLPTPLPLAVAMQALVSDRAAPGADHPLTDGARQTSIIDITANPKSHSWALPGSVSVLGGDVPEHEIAVGGIFSTGLTSAQTTSALTKYGIRVNRADHLTILNSLARRADNGISAFVVAGDKSAGLVAPDMRRVLSHVGSRYEIVGLVDIDAAMIAPGNDTSSRLIVIGNKRAEVDETFMVPSHLPVLYDYESLWNFIETLKAGAGEEMSFGDDGREENRWQAPYIPSSQISEPKAMSPRNLLGPVRRALAKIVETEGVGIDEYVASKLGWTLQEMEEKKYLDAEQIDAVALMIFAAEKTEGFVQADATGMGKGRTLAAMMRYYRLRDQPIVFVTEKAALFRDIYRDIQDIGSLDLFTNPLIINGNVVLRSFGGEIIGQSPSRDEMMRILLADQIPERYPLTLATYSQFNRPARNVPDAHKRILQAIDKLGAGELTRHTAIEFLKSDLGIRIEDAQGETDNEAALKALRARLSLADPDSDLTGPLKRQIELREMSDADFLQLLSALGPQDMMQLKQHWIRGNAMSGVLLALDESHNAAGATSTTNENISFAVRRAETVMYSSATFAKDTESFQLYNRIFPAGMDTSTISEALARGGEPLQEILSAGLAEDGRMIRREHDNSNVEFRVLPDSGRIERNEQWADSLAKVLSAMSYLSGEVSSMATALDEEHAKEFAKAVEETDAKGRSKASKKIRSIGVQYTNFSSRFYNITRSFMMAIKADLAAERAITARQEGRKPILTVENTMESVLVDMLTNDLGLEAPGVRQVGTPSGEAAEADEDRSDDLDLSVLDPLADGSMPAPARTAAAPASIKRGASVNAGKYLGFKDILRKYADNVFFAWEIKYQDKKVVSKKRLELKKPELEEAVKVVYKLIEEMPDVPLSPIDMVREKVEQAGFSFEEISGRKLRVETNKDGTHSVARFTKDDRNKIVDRFNSGETDVLLLTKSGSTGISAHASIKFLDQSQRELIEWQPISNVVGRQQSHGRHNRKDQVTPPMVTMLSSMLPGELRLQMMQNAALRKVSAMTSGNADNAAIDESVPDLLNRVGNEVCFRWLENNPTTAKMMGINMAEADGDPSKLYGTRWVDALTGKFMMLTVADQRRVYKELDTEFRALIEQYELEGRNPLKSGQFDIKAKRHRSKVYEVSPLAKGTVFAEDVTVSEILYEVSAEGLDPEVLRAEAQQGREDLVRQWGDSAWFHTVADLIDRECDAVLPQLVGEDFASLEAALVSEKPNAARNYQQKAEAIKEWLPKIVPGSFLRVSSGFRSRDLMYVVGLDVPKDPRRICSPSEYRVRMRSGSTRKAVSMTLSSIINMGSAITVDLSWGFAKYKEYEAFNIAEFEGDRRSQFSRVILDGNLFRASMLADKAKTGQAITYTDEKGVWRHAVMLPSEMTYSAAYSAIPLDITDARKLEAMLREHDTVAISDAQKRDSRTYEIFKDTKGVINVYLLKAGERCSWMASSDELAATLTTEFKGGRTIKKAVVSDDKLADFCRIFIAESQSRKIPCTTSGHLREWDNEFNAKLKTDRAAAAELAAVAAEEAMQGQGLGAELEAMGF